MIRIAGDLVMEAKEEVRKEIDRLHSENAALRKQLAEMRIENERMRSAINCCLFIERFKKSVNPEKI